MKTFKAYFISVVLLSVICFISCKKDDEEDSDFPDITFYAPVNNPVYNVYDSVYVSAYVSSGKNLQSVSVTLTTTGFTPVQDPYIYTPSGNSQNIEVKYPIYEFRLTSGYYYICIKAVNENNSSTKQQLIYINASPFIKTGYFLLSDNGFQTTISKLDTLFTSGYIKTMNGKYVGSALSNYYQRLFMAGGAGQNAQMYDIGTGNVKWNVPNYGSGNPFFSFCQGDATASYLGYMAGNIKRLDNTGTTLTNYNYTNTDYYAEYGAVQASNFVVHMQSRSSSNKKLVVFNQSYGAALTEAPINFKTVGIFEKSASEVYVIGNDVSNQAQLSIFNTSATGFQNPLSLPAGMVLSACQVDSNTVIFGHSDGNIYKYQYSNNNLTSIQSGITANKMKYSKGENYLYTAYAKQFNVYSINGSSLSPVTSYLHTDTIRDFHVIFNK
jgi:hypothetical protein